jgi:hypothetical protein
MQYKDLLKTRDFEKAWILSASGCFWETTELDSSGVITFVFEDKEKCEEVWKQHRLGELEINSKSLLTAHRELKKVLHNS